MTKDEARLAIRNWMVSVMEANQWENVYAWSQIPGAPSYRMMKRAYDMEGDFVPSTSKLVQMAEAAEVAPPNIGTLLQSIPLPTAQALEPAVRLVVSAAAPGRSLPEPAVRMIARVLRDTLAGYVDRPEAADDPKETRLLAQSALRLVQESGRGTHAA